MTLVPGVEWKGMVVIRFQAYDTVCYEVRGLRYEDQGGGRSLQGLCSQM
jgi:hypothetical protein